MRVITGIARGRKLQALPGQEVRPTTDMVKEAMFSIVQFEVEEAMVLDLFAGSGQLGIEALSRGARSCVFVDQSRDAQAVIRENLAATGLSSGGRVAAMDSMAFLAGTKDRFDIALLDPPYRQGLIPKVLPALVPKMSSGGAILCETQVGEELPQEVEGWKIAKTYRYGKVALTLYRGEEEL